MPVRVASFDVGGTLVDNHYLDFVWNKAIPRLYAKQMKIDFESAKEYVLREYARVGDDWSFDYVAPRKIGIRAFYLDRTRRVKNDFVVKDLRELKTILLCR